MRRRSTFRKRVLVALVAFVLIAQAIVAAAVLRMSYVRTLAQAQDQLAVGERVLHQLIALRDQQLLSSVDILTSDFGFKSAVATEDKPTLRTSLANFAARVNADFAVLLSPNGTRLTALAARGAPPNELPAEKLLRKARRTGSGSGLVMIDHRPTQFVLVPVRAPRLIAWAGMGFVIDHRFARTVSELTELGVTFQVTDHGKTIYSATSSAEGQTPAQNAAELTRRKTLLDNGDVRLSAILSLNRARVLTGYYTLATRLLLIFLVTLLASAVLALWLSRRLSAPVAALSHFARRIASGAYSELPPTHGIGELEELSQSLTDMRDAVAERENRIRHQATHDPLTGLPNRGQARRFIDNLLVRERRFAAVRLSVREFGSINSALGYQLGDRTLQIVAQRLLAAAGDRDLAARTEGNDFLLIIDAIDDRQQLDAPLARLRETLEAPMEVAGTALRLEFAIGVLLSPADAWDTETVWRRSVIAREWSGQRRGSIVFYDAGMDERQFRELTIIRDLPRAVARDEFSLVYQPKLRLDTGAVEYVEALLRWQHPTLGQVTPDEFVGLAERSGQIGRLTRWVAQAASRQLSRWRYEGIPLGIALNLSADEIADPELETVLRPVIDAARSPADVIFEVTESALLREPDAARGNLRRLQALGARIAIDDFGTGYSSFSQLRTLGADELKIDKSLIFSLDQAEADRQIVAAIIALGHDLGLDVVAEGLENETIWRFLSAHGADSVQGFYIARPMPSDALVDWLHAHRAEAPLWAAAASAN